MGDLPVCLDGNLDIIAVCPLYQANPFYLAEREGGKRARFLAAGVGSNQAQRANAHTIREGEMEAIRLQLPARGLVLDRAIIMLEPRIAFLAWLPLAAIFVEAGNGEPGPVCRC